MANISNVTKYMLQTRHLRCRELLHVSSEILFIPLRKIFCLESIAIWFLLLRII